MTSERVEPILVKIFKSGNSTYAVPLKCGMYRAVVMTEAAAAAALAAQPGTPEAMEVERAN